MTIINLNATIKTKDHDGYKAIVVNELQWALDKFQHEFVECQTPEGPSDDFSWKITLVNWFTGEEYVLKTVVYGRTETHEYEDEENGFYDCQTLYVNGRSRADRLIEQIKTVGKVDLDNWIKVS